ncbi:hypothetical protein LTR29_000728 [Friedmanniomyces endolithicus]|uniref:G-protein coupled receptors family 1 profile domain-containing protein n=1 Tax=Rachicladosporium monterosium TaxID=1507873 RepID=A0ABR0LBR9_9PEZI|nr:hypothetical protein LTR29_000728 [Friedmanniomyces endolithicus]KAK5146473.1 hypothetical protein LTR32_001931 [Rachicladosporium monterosium]
MVPISVNTSSIQEYTQTTPICGLRFRFRLGLKLGTYVHSYNTADLHRISLHACILGGGLPDHTLQRPAPLSLSYNASSKIKLDRPQSHPGKPQVPAATIMVCRRGRLTLWSHYFACSSWLLCSVLPIPASALFQSQHDETDASVGSRLQSVFNRRYWGSLPFIRMLPYFLYTFGILFNIAAAVSISGTFNLTREKDCRGAMYVCLVFYVATKTCVQLFLIERAHAARTRSPKRLQDWIWLLFMFVLIVGFGTIAILAFMAPVGILDPIDKQCRIGLPRTSVMVLMTYDILINIALTAAFIALLLPLLRSTPNSARARLLQSPTHSQNLKMHAPRHQKSVESALSGTSSSGSTDTAPSISHYTPTVTMDTTARDAQANRLRMLIGKSTFGAVVMLTATILNLAFLYKYRGAEHGWICFACCLIDVTWAVTVVHLLTDSVVDDRASLVSQLHSSEARGARYQRLAASRNTCNEG